MRPFCKFESLNFITQNYQANELDKLIICFQTHSDQVIQLREVLDFYASDSLSYGGYCTIMVVDAGDILFYFWCLLTSLKCYSTVRPTHPA